MKQILVCVLLLCNIAFVFGQECLNVDFKLRGYFYVGSSIKDISTSGYYKDENYPIKLENENLKENTFKIVAKTDSVCEFAEGVLGFKLFIINGTDSTITLPAQDSRIYLKRQVFYKNKWKDIEYLPSSWCGNSYHNVYIEPNEYWDLTAPCLVGNIKATFRFELFVNDKLSYYSNEFQGSFNKEQLKKEQGYNAIGIMDPYDN